MTYYEKKTGELFVSTAVYPNRVKDKLDLENVCDLVESGSDKFQFRSKAGSLIARGYVRVVYGDHGPFLEFTTDQVAWENMECERRDLGYFNKWYTKLGRVLVYEQLRTVRNLPNPPVSKFAFRGNRKEGV